MLLIISLVVSSDTMKISSKSSSHLVPVRRREPPQVSLAASRSRRLRTSGSVNGGKASPMFRLVENPEPSSPKVTCIGQVRVKKNKRIGRKTRSRSRRRSNAKWVHLPLTICEALRGFGADFNCFTSERDKIEEEKPGISSSCRTLMAELMVEDGGERKSSQRRQLFEGIEFKEEDYSGFECVCIPPKNALLLMRCRSDPVKMAALVKRLLETSASVIEEEREEDEDEDENVYKISPEAIFKQEREITGNEDEKDEYPDKEFAVENGGNILVTDNELQQSNKPEEPDEEKLEGDDYSSVLIQKMTALIKENGEEGENENFRQTVEDGVAEKSDDDDEEEEESENSRTQNHKSKERESGNSKLERESSAIPDCLLLMMHEPKLSMEVSKETWVCSTDFIRCQPAREKKKQDCKINDSNEPTKRSGGDDSPPPRTEGSEPPAVSSCSFPATTAASMVSLKEQKLVLSKAREPFALTRCQSEPWKSAAKLAPDSFFWKGTKVEPYCSARIGLNTAWVGL